MLQVDTLASVMDKFKSDFTSEERGRFIEALLTKNNVLIKEEITEEIWVVLIKVPAFGFVIVLELVTGLLFENFYNADDAAQFYSEIVQQLKN